MPKFKLVYFETTKIVVEQEAATLEEAIALSGDDTGWDGAEEFTLGTNGVEEVYDEAGNKVYDAGLDDDEDDDEGVLRLVCPDSAQKP